MSAPELKPCPFCGSPGPIYQMAWGIRCTACDASVPCAGDDFGPWNRRHTPEALAASPEVQALIRDAVAAERGRVVDELCDALHLCDAEALDICIRIGGNFGRECRHPDGVQVLEDAEKIIRAAWAAIRARGGE